MSLDYHVVLDLSSGIFFGANEAFVIDTRQIPPDELEVFNEGSDSDRREIGEQYGTDLEDWAKALDSIASLLNGKECDLDAIADIIRSTGRTIN